MPELSIVIPSYKRETRLGFTLDALARQTAPRESFEVIVVRDSEDGPLTIAPAGLDVRFLTLRAPGPAMRRNRGWREARAPLVAFTDDDCRPAPGWVEGMLRAAAGIDGRPVVLEGRTVPDPDEEHLLYGIARSMDVPSPDRWYPTCNLAMPRALLERLGGFDESLAFFGEDTDLGLRAERVGAELRFVEGAVVWHAVHVRSLGQALRDATDRHTEAAVLARHPEHRSELYLGAFVSIAHARWVLAAAGALAAWLTGRRRLAAVAAAPYVVYKAKRRTSGIPRRPRGFLRLAAVLAEEGLLDGVEVAMRARSSLQNRQLVL